MDIYDIIVDAPVASTNFIFNNNSVSLLIFGVTLLISLLFIVYYRRFISICTLHYIATLLKHDKISYKNFAYLLAKILCYRHKATRISKKEPPFKSSKKKQYVWIALVDILNEVRYGKDTVSAQSHTKLYKTALEWLRHS